MSSALEYLPWPFLAVLTGPPRVSKGEGPLGPPEIRGLGYVFGEHVVTVKAVADAADGVEFDGVRAAVARTTRAGPEMFVLGTARAGQTNVGVAELAEAAEVSVAYVGDDPATVGRLSGHANVPGPDGAFTVGLDSRVPARHSAIGSPVVVGDAVVGIVVAMPRAPDVLSASSVGAARRLIEGRLPPLAATRPPVSVATRNALGYAAEIADAVDAPAAVLLGVLWSGAADHTPTAAFKLKERVPPSIDHVAEALGAEPPDKPASLTDDELWDSSIEPMLAAAEDIRGRGGGRRMHRRHLLVAALSRPPDAFPERTFAELGLPLPELRDALREILAERHRDERGVWEPLLGPPYELQGGTWSDLVDPNKGIRLDRDRLDLSVDVKMLATLIADVKTPMPLSVGLFGEWGSGKSYFMGLLREQIYERSRSADPRYRSEVRQIGFNAWHYADSNLWASLGDEVFDKLAGPQSESTEEQQVALRQALSDRLQRRQELKTAAESAQDETARLATAVQVAGATRRTSARALAAAVLDSATMGEQLGPAWRRLGAITREERIRALADELEQSREDIGVVRRAVSRAPRWVLPAGTVVAGAAIAAGALASQAPAGVAVALAAAGTVAARLRSGARALHEVADGLRRGQDQAVANEFAALGRAETNERVLRTELDEVDRQVRELSRELAELTPGRRLYSFLAERAASDAYRGQLGLISTIRKDFEQLAALMKEWKTQEGADGAKQPIDRIVLYIDDLDRCSPEQVVEVLQAVHLLLALELFVVVVGVDPRWLLHSLRHEYRTMLTTGAPGAGRDPRWETTPQDYLEKIFNIPFALPRMSPRSFEQLVGSFADAKTRDHVRHAVAETPEQPAQAATPAQPAPSGRPNAERTPVQVAPMDAEPKSEVSESQTDGTAPERRPLTKPELKMLGALAPLVGTPRETKRLVNLYRMMRSTRDLSPASRFLGDDGHPGEHQAVVILLGLLSGHARLLHDVLLAPPRDKVPGGLRDRGSTGRWADFAAGLAPRAVEDGFENDIIGAIPERDVEEWARLADGLKPASALVTIPDLKPFQDWAPRISRFSFLLSPYAEDPTLPA